MYKTLHKKQGSVTVQLRFARSSVTFCAKRDKYKSFFGVKAKMLTVEQVSELIGHEVGGVCPYGIKEGVKVYLDESLKRFDVVYPACGSSNSAVKLSIPDLEKSCDFEQWVDVCKLPQ